MMNLAISCVMKKAIYANDIDGSWETYDSGKIEEKCETEKLRESVVANDEYIV